MPVYLLKEGAEGDAPFGRPFFTATLESIRDKAGGDAGSQKLALFLTDGLALDVCRIEELAERYLVVRGYAGTGTACDVRLHVIPYGLIYRIELGPKPDGDNRLGFDGTRPAASEAAAATASPPR